MANRVGQDLGNYHLVHLLRQGGFAEVYLGVHRYFESQAAVKVPRLSLTNKEAQLFLSEAQALFRLKHPHIVYVLEFAIEQIMPILIMDCAPEGTFRQCHPHGSRLSLATTVFYVKQVAAALQYAHNHNVIHRDVKSENILPDSGQHPLLSNFGLALLTPSPDLLSTQEMAGTPPYIAPEQLQGKLTFASDQYALGIIAYEWLCGTRPFEGAAWEIIHQHMTAAPPALQEKYPGLPAGMEVMVKRVLAEDPRQRFVSIQAYTLALERASKENNSRDSNDDLEVTAPLKAIFHEEGTSQVVPLGPSLAEPPSVTRNPYNTKAEHSLAPLKSSNHQRLLAKVHAFWIMGVLAQSLHGAALIALVLHERLDTVANTWRLVLQQSNITPHPLPSGTRIAQVYDDAGDELLIIGKPGSGKTTLLLELACDPLDRDEIDDAHLMPVVFNLSSWTEQQQPVTDWLVEELNSKYQVPRMLGQSWIDANQVLPLLDGLAEVTYPTSKR